MSFKSLKNLVSSERFESSSIGQRVISGMANVMANISSTPDFPSEYVRLIEELKEVRVQYKRAQDAARIFFAQQSALGVVETTFGEYMSGKFDEVSEVFKTLASNREELNAKLNSGFMRDLDSLVDDIKTAKDACERYEKALKDHDTAAQKLASLRAKNTEQIKLAQAEHEEKTAKEFCDQKYASAIEHLQYHIQRYKVEHRDHLRQLSAEVRNHFVACATAFTAIDSCLAEPTEKPVVKPPSVEQEHVPSTSAPSTSSPGPRVHLPPPPRPSRVHQHNQTSDTHHHHHHHYHHTSTSTAPTGVDYGSRLFGVPLEFILQREKSESLVPLFVEQCCTYIEENGLDAEGIYRISGSSQEIQEIKRQLDEGQSVDFSNILDPHVVAGLLKQFFRELPEPIFTTKLYHKFLQIVQDTTDEQATESLRDQIQMLPESHQATLRRLLKHLRAVSSRSDENKMTPSNLAIVFGHNLLRSGSDNPIELAVNAPQVNRVIELCVAHQETILTKREGGNSGAPYVPPRPRHLARPPAAEKEEGSIPTMDSESDQGASQEGSMNQNSDAADDSQTQYDD